MHWFINLRLTLHLRNRRTLRLKLQRKTTASQLFPNPKVTKEILFFTILKEEFLGLEENMVFKLNTRGIYAIITKQTNK